MRFKRITELDDIIDPVRETHTPGTGQTYVIEVTSIHRPWKKLWQKSLIVEGFTSPADTSFAEVQALASYLRQVKGIFSVRILG